MFPPLAFANARVRDSMGEIREQRISGHQRCFGECIAGLQFPERLACAVRQRRSRYRPAQDDTEMSRFATLMSDCFVRFKRSNSGAVHQLFDAVGGEILEQADVFLDEARRVHE